MGWLAADRRPELVEAIVAVKSMGPAFVEFPGMGALQWGRTAAAVTYDPLLESPQAAQDAAPATRRIPGLSGKDMLLVTGSAAPFAGFAEDVVEFLGHAGARPQRLHFPEQRVPGNGHALQMEANAADTVRPVLDWLIGREQNRTA